MSRDGEQSQLSIERTDPVQAVPNPVINNPYDEPSRYWVYAPDGSPYEAQGRRPASYFSVGSLVGSMQQDLYAEEERDDLPLVNRLRADVKRWREAGYRGATRATKQLLSYWTQPDRPRQLFFCQREAIETLIYLLELGMRDELSRTGFKSFRVTAKHMTDLLSGVRPDFEEIHQERTVWPSLRDQPHDSNVAALTRMGCKMATGSGKTLVMAMLITWAFVNRGLSPSSSWFPNAVLVVAPNLTVKERLQVLRPDNPQSYYRQFDLVPPSYWPFLNEGRVLVTNWHVLGAKSEHAEGGKSYRVVNKGQEPADAFARDRLGELADRLPILVINDEGHHCWRPKLTDATTDDADTDQDVEEARIWLSGLDRINNCGLPGSENGGILAALDFSATPFYFGNSGYAEGTPFPWLVSDFGLVDAIECGIVKVPRLPVRDDAGGKDEAGRPDPKYFRLWHNITSDLTSQEKKKEKNKRKPKPEAVFDRSEGALQTLYAQWKTAFDERKEKSEPGKFIPPAMIVVCNDTELAQYFFEQISGEQVVKEPVPGKSKKQSVTRYNGSQFPEFANSERQRYTIKIDSQAIEKQETGQDESKAKAASQLRHMVDTVGKRGEPGEQIRCVVSVSMLTEGWDANNVTHILGVRAFGSQLLAEQVVGRGLRRLSYTPNPDDGLLPAEYVDVYGIPFSLIPFKGKGKEPKESDPVYVDVYAREDRQEYEVRVPLVRAYTYELRESGITCDVDGLEGLQITKSDEPTEVWVRVQKGIAEGPQSVNADADTIRQDRSAYYESFRMQQFEYNTARRIVDDLVSESTDASLNRAHLFPEVLRILREYITKKVLLPEGVDIREIALELNARKLRERLEDGIILGATKKEAPLLPVLNLAQPFVSTRDIEFKTTMDVVYLRRSHLNCAPVHSKQDGEAKAMRILEDSSHAQYFAPNVTRMGFSIGYEYQGQSHEYEPDFFVRLTDESMLVLETKGVAGELHYPDMVNAKNAAARKWVQALNNSGEYGRWRFAICRDLDALDELLQKAASGDPEPEVLEC